MESVQAKEQLNYLIASMYEMELLDAQFKELQMLEDGNGFVAEIITMFCAESEEIVFQLELLLSQSVVDFEVAAAYVHKFKGSCSYVGAKKVALGCTRFLKFYHENDKERCIVVLPDIMREFAELHQKFKTMLQLEQQIQALDAKQRNKGNVGF